MTERKRYEGDYMAFKSSYDGKALFEVSLTRKNRNGNSEHLFIEVEVSRSSLYCIHKSIKAFADREREQVAGMPL